jgi:hypothetical protein
MGYIISATAKDFTIIMRIVEPKSKDFEFNSVNGLSEDIWHESLLEYEGR